MTSDIEIDEVYDELQRRIAHIGIALCGRRIHLQQEIERYDLTSINMPKVGETVYAFLNWNCGILTAFRSLADLTIEENVARNKGRNENLKANLHEQNLMFRAVDGWYKEYGTDKFVKELSMFVTNIDNQGNKLDKKDFFKKLYRLAEHYEQDCFLFTFPGANRVAFLVATNDNGRKDFRDTIKFAGPLFTHIEGLDAWTQCEDGKISFMLKGMILEGGTGNKKVWIGEGNFFDIDDDVYKPSGLAMIYDSEQEDIKSACHDYHGNIPLAQRYFMKDNPTAEEIYRKVWEALNDLRDKKCKRIGFHSSTAIDGSYIAGAKVAYNAVLAWAKRNDRRFESIIIVDTYGDYGKVINSNK